MAKVNKNFKEMKDAEIWVNVIVGSYRDEFGRTIRKAVWRKLDADLDFGSLKHPKNTNVIGVKVVSKEKNPIDIRGFFDNLFGG